MSTPPEPMDTLLTTVPPAPSERLVARILVLVSAVTVLVAAPFAPMPLGEVKPFIPAYQSALFITDFITATLLFGQFTRSRTLALLMLASAYLFDSAIIVAHTLSFPGLFAPTGLLGVGPQTTAWLYTFWHGGFSAFVLAYALLSRAPTLRVRRVGVAIALGCFGVLLLCAVLTLAATAGHDFLPVLMQGSDYSPMVRKGVSPALLVVSLAAIAVLWERRRRDVLDLWLIVVLCAWLCDVALSAVVGSHRYDLGFYAGRAYGLVASSFLLIVLLIKAMNLQDELMRSHEALAKARHFESIGQLTGGLAHDFNNLLTVVIGAFEVITRLCADRPRVVQLSERGLASASRGAKLTQQLLTFARRQYNQPETVNLNKLLRELEPLLQQGIGSGIELAYTLSPVLEPVRIDPAQFEAAILNLVVNAREAMPTGGRIEIATSNVTLSRRRRDADALQAGTYAVVTVRDTGLGMSAEVVARAIEPFFTTKGVGRGSGLGLSQVYGFARSFGGSLEIDSSPGEGTSIRLYLPRTADAAKAEMTTRSLVPVSLAANDGATVLVVEDDEKVLANAVDGLTELGYRAIARTNAEHALETVRADPSIDILFSDIVMPNGMNGAQLAEEARRIKPRLKVLLTSGYTAEALQARGIPIDLALLTKPYGREELAARLRLVS